MAEYVALSQDEKESSTTSLEGSDSYTLAPEDRRFWTSPLFFTIVLLTLLAVNVICLVFTTRQVNVVYDVLKTRLDFVNTQDLPKLKVRGKLWVPKGLL